MSYISELRDTQYITLYLLRCPQAQAVVLNCAGTPSRQDDDSMAANEKATPQGWLFPIRRRCHNRPQIVVLPTQSAQHCRLFMPFLNAKVQERLFDADGPPLVC